MAAIGFGVFVLVMLPAVAIIVVGVLVLSDAGSAGVGAGAVLIGLGAILFAAGVILSGALQQIFAVVLYRYTTSGEALGGFSAEDIESAVRTRPAVAPA
jgi:hypothetical protein